MNISKVSKDKKVYIDLLLLADEQESMIDKYLEHGEMFVLNDNGVKAQCVVTKEADNYDHPMFEDGKQLIDMVYLKRGRGGIKNE